MLKPRLVAVVGDAQVEWTKLGACGVEWTVERNRTGDGE